MPRTAEKVRSLIEEDPGFGEAIATVLEEADRRDGEVEWADVREDLTSGQWGRLIESGVLVDGGRGFSLADEGAAKDVLDELNIEYLVATASETDTDEIEETPWTTWDKGAAVLTIMMFAGYMWEPARNVAGNALDVVLGPLVELIPFYAVIMILALFTGLYSTLLQANLMDAEKMGKYQERMKAIQAERKRAKEAGDEEALERIQQEQFEAMGDQLGMFKEQFRPMVWIMFITIPVFLWLLWGVSDRLGTPTYGTEDLGQVVLPFASGAMEWSQALIWYFEAWLLWYFLCSLAFTQVIRKSLNISMTPTGS